ncbi:putative acetyltransferase [Marinomonas spartinae]|uniref:GNAT family N-acetyltransferase n=1 Tax=Marinomonas spartinae TaxID=1792290 RepID=UPI000808E73A|nr:GNAT family N-acetyltransferase [Marinomonas spartinae]SBS38935.1 putative acetyltransferase [Marinomonas spartinae]
MEIKKLQKADLEGLLRLYRHLHLDDEHLEFEKASEIWAQSAKNDAISYWGLFLKSTLVSSCQLVQVPNLTRGGRAYCLIENVVTHPEYRNRGYGKTLLTSVLDHAWSQGCYKAMLMTGRSEESVLEFYGSVGFNGGEKQAFIAKPSNI